MRRLYDLLPGFHSELEKIAGLTDFVAKHHGALGSAGAGLGYGTAAGAVLGGLHGAKKQYDQAKEQGSGTGGAAFQGALGALGGASSGATAGALIGGGAGAALHTLRPQAAESLRKSLSSTSNPVGALGRFGQRQMHGLTGWEPTEGLSSDAIRGGSWGTAKALGGAVGDKAKEKALKAHQLQEDVVKKGLTSLPGVGRALAGPDRLQAGKALAKHTWTNADMLTKAQLGLVPVGLAAAAMSSDEHGGPGKGEAIGGSLGQTAGTIAGTAMPFLPGQIAMRGAHAVGKTVGKGVDMFRRKRTEVEAPDLQNEQHIPTERHTSLSAREV